MIQKPNNWNDVKAFDERPKIPAGGYVAKIVQAVKTSASYGDSLNVLIDIAEGEYAGYYSDMFNHSQDTNRKWKGVLRLWLWKNDGSESDERSKSIFKGFETAVNESNAGEWNWDEAALKGKLIGVLFRSEEWEYEGKSGWVARPFKAVSVDRIRSGKFSILKEKPLKRDDVYIPEYSDSDAPPVKSPTFMELESADGDLPF